MNTRRRALLLPSFLRPLGGRKKGMTMIELAIVMGVVSALMALVLGLARHVDATVKIRRAQAELGEWHESLNRWHLQFGEYPHARIDTTAVDPDDSVDSLDFVDSIDPLALLTNRCEIIMPLSGSTTTINITFRSFLTSAVSTVDPWGTPYIYRPAGNAQAYTLFSCGPDRKSDNIPTGTPSTPDPTLDDIHFER